MPPLLAPGRRAALTVGLSLAVFMNVLDLSIANVAIPAIAGALGASADQGTWVITSFAVSAAIAMPLTGWLGRRFGEVRVFLACTAGFTAASVLCGLAPSLAILITMRAVQGALAGPMIPLSQSLLLNNYPDDRKNFAFAFLMMVTVVAPVAGPILGGWITDNWSWEWIFYINVPAGLAAVVVSGVLLRGRETPTTRAPVDAVGVGLLALGVGSLQILLDRGKDLDWFGSPTIVVLALVAAVGLTFFVAWELTDAHPAVDLRLFRQRNFAAGTVALCLGYSAYFGNVVLLPLWLQTQEGYTATWAGLATAPIGVLPMLLAALVARSMSFVDLRWLTTASFGVLGAVSFWYAGFNSEVTFGLLAWSRVAQGLGVALFFVPLMTIVLSGLPAGRVASASGLANTLRTLAGSFATSLTTTLWDRREALHHSHLAEGVTAFDPATRATLDQLHALGAHGAAALAALDRTIVRQAYMLATNDLFFLWGWLFLALIGVLWFARPPFTPAGARGAGH